MSSRIENLAPIGDADFSVLAGRHFGAWVVARTDPTGRRALVVCKCGETRQVAIEALTVGESVGCGCRLTRHRPGYPQADRDAFASAVAKQESRSSWKRHVGAARNERGASAEADNAKRISVDPDHRGI